MYKIFVDATDRVTKKVHLEKIADGKTYIIASKEGDIDLVTAIKQLLCENDLKVKDIDSFYAPKGPGSFTGLKMSYAVVNMLQYASGSAPQDLLMPEYGAEPNIQPK
jgi:tRNA A37 threonylcarbamoyladenosine modification protein TsaB